MATASFHMYLRGRLCRIYGYEEVVDRSNTVDFIMLGVDVIENEPRAGYTCIDDGFECIEESLSSGELLMISAAYWQSQPFEADDHTGLEKADSDVDEFCEELVHNGRYWE